MCFNSKGKKYKNKYKFILSINVVLVGRDPCTVRN